MNDHERKDSVLKAVSIPAADGDEEYYSVGSVGVTSIEWGSTCGHMAELKTVVVYKGDKVHSEHPFSNVRAVYYA